MESFPWLMSRLKTDVVDYRNWDVLVALLLLHFKVSSFPNAPLWCRITFNYYY